MSSRASLPLVDYRLEPVEPPLPSGSVPLDPRGRVLQLSRPQPALARSAPLLRGHEVRLLQDAHVLQRAGERDPRRRGKLAHRGGTERQPLEHGPARRIGERRERAIERLKVNHSVHYTRGEVPCPLGCLSGCIRGSRLRGTACTASVGTPPRILWILPNEQTVCPGQGV